MIVCPIGLAEGKDCNSFMVYGVFTQHVDRNGNETEAMFTTAAEADALTCNEHDEDAFIMGTDPYVFDNGLGIEESGPQKQYQYMDEKPEDADWWSFERGYVLQKIGEHNASL